MRMVEFNPMILADEMEKLARLTLIGTQARALSLALNVLEDHLFAHPDEIGKVPLAVLGEINGLSAAAVGVNRVIASCLVKAGEKGQNAAYAAEPT